MLKRTVNISLRFKFLLLLGGLLLLLFAAITFMVVHEDSRTLKTKLVTSSKSFAALATEPIGSVFETYQDSGTLKIQDKVNSVAALEPDINQIEIIDTQNNQLFIKDSSAPIKIDRPMALKVDPSYLYNAKGDLISVVQPYIENYGIHKYNIVYGISYANVNQNIKNLIVYISLLTVLILSIVFIIGYLLVDRFFLYPVIAISQLALVISRGNFGQRVISGRNDEIGDLATAVDTMAISLKNDIDKLTQLDKMKNEFLMIASHNLRTPITVIEGYLEIIRTSADNQFQKLLEPISASVSRLHGFAEDMLNISEIEAGHNSLNLVAQPVGPLLQKIANEFTAQAKQKNINFTADIKTNAKIKISPPQFRNALWNLLDNAYKFAPVGGKIALTAQETGHQLHISVSDNGPGIKADEIGKLFTKFHRGTSTEHYDYEGSGIGLYLSKIIINQHNGDISVNSTEGMGATFTVTLPVSV